MQPAAKSLRCCAVVVVHLIAVLFLLPVTTNQQSLCRCARKEHNVAVLIVNVCICHRAPQPGAIYSQGGAAAASSKGTPHYPDYGWMASRIVCFSTTM